MTQKELIKSALSDFQSNKLYDASINLFKKLGYNTYRATSFIEKTYEDFKYSFDPVNEEKALVNDWKSISLLFQLTDEEMKDIDPEFNQNQTADITKMESYLFFAIELSKPEYNMTALAQITREINKRFPMPVMILFKYNDFLAFSIIQRRLNKTNQDKDVLEKVTFIKDISISNTHRAHIDILFDLSLPQLKGKYDIKNFVKLHEAWQKVLDVRELNKRFYKDIADWYHWAVEQSYYPNDLGKEENTYKSESIIRLLTRLVFVWFIKQKGFVNDVLFYETKLKGILKGFKNQGSNVYYRAILQNLFFATLNQEIKDRRFINSERKEKNLYRYAEDFNISQSEVIEIFSQTPFLNGGLFDCLDKDENGVTYYQDGFCELEDKQAKLPDELFFSNGENGKKGIVNIFNQYKFTVAENTPIEEDVALDPELLGKIFENLLATYNPETAETARKATGSYYTPREIVDYMVNESLKEYLRTKLPEIEEDKIEQLLSYYSEETPEFSEEEKQKIISAINEIKIIDPACGSGAFPMGILHKLVYVLRKIDKNNKYWQELQYQKALKETEDVFKHNDKNEREELLKEINDVFDESMNDPDYARKLYLIENCIYGVDIQQIAIQISKLRFFISLIIDQKTNKNKDENFGIKPLPNLETKFVCANTLIGLEKLNLGYIEEIDKLENKIKKIRHKYFTTNTRQKKLELQSQDKVIREKLKENINKIETGRSVILNEFSYKIASFNIFDPSASTDWFDPEWMFGVVDGFDIVIGNPPYVRQENIKDKESIIDSISKCFVKGGKSLVEINRRSDLYIYFYYKGLSLLKTSGVLCYISSNSWLDVGFGVEFQEFLLKYMHPLMIVDNIAERSFEADINTVIVLIKKPEKISLEDLVKFIVFKKSFDEILNSEILKIVRQTYDKVINEDFRVIPKTRRELWIEGIEFEGDEIKEKDFLGYNYIGNKWGNKYLRAPEIFFKILEKGKGKFVRLGSIASDHYGIKTGANDFFYLESLEKSSNWLLYVKNSSGWEGYIEKDFLKPVIKSPRELNTIVVKEEDLKYRVFMCHKSKNELKGTYALEYIEWGEKQGYHKRSTCASRQRWWDLGESKGNILCQGNINDRFIFFYNKDNVIFEHTLYGFLIDISVENYILNLNSSLTSLFQELNGRITLGEGALGIMVYEYRKIPILGSILIPVEKFQSLLTRHILSIFEELGFQKCNKKKCNHPEHPYEHVKPEEVSFDRIMPDRRELDKIIFQTLNLTEEEQLEVYKAVIELVKNRLLKAKSK